MSDLKEEKKPSLIGMITNPVEQFKRIKNRPVFWGALTIIIIIFIVGITLSFQYMDISGELADELAKELGTEVDEEMEEFLAFAQNVGVFIGGVVGPVIGVVIASVVHLLVGKIVQASVTFRRLFSMNSHIMLITALGVLVNGILAFIFKDGFDGTFTSLGIFFNPEDSLGAMASRFEIFAIWNLILTAIGLQKVAEFSKEIAWGVPIVMFIVSMLFGM